MDDEQSDISWRRLAAGAAFGGICGILGGAGAFGLADAADMSFRHGLESTFAMFALAYTAGYLLATGKELRRFIRLDTYETEAPRRDYRVSPD